MQMRKKGVRKSSVCVGEEDIAIVEEYKYLGHAVDAHGQCRRMVKERAKAGETALGNWLGISWGI